MAAQLTFVNPAAATLYEVEDNLQALANSIAAAEEPTEREAILAQIAQALETTKEKRDRVAAFLRHCEFQKRFADEEVERIEKRKAFIARVQTELERRVIQVVEQFAPPDRRGVKRLQGNSSSLRIQKNPDSVLVADPNMVPPAFKAAVITMPAYAWDALLNCLDVEERKEIELLVDKIEFKADKRAIGIELKNGTAVAGADLRFGEWRLVLE